MLSSWKRPKHKKQQSSGGRSGSYTWRRRKRLKERTEAIEDFMWFHIEMISQDRGFGEIIDKLQDFVDSPSGIVLAEIIGRKRIWALADWFDDAMDECEYMTMGHLMIEWNKLHNFLLAFAWKSKCAWGPNPLRWEVPLTRLKSMVMALGTHRRVINPCKRLTLWELRCGSRNALGDLML